MSSESTSEIVRVQRIREFSHFTAARLFLDGYKLLDFDPDAARKCFIKVIELDPANPYGWIYYLFSLEDSGGSLLDCVEVCDKLVSVAGKKDIHGLGGISKQMMVGYIKKVEKMIEEKKETFIN